MVDVTVYGGKYRYVFNNDGAKAYRHGEEWRDCCGDGFILALAQDLEEARQQRDALAEGLREAVEWDSHDDHGVEAVWLSKARDALQQLEG